MATAALARRQFLSGGGAAARRSAGSLRSKVWRSRTARCIRCSRPGRCRCDPMRLLHAGLCDGDVRLCAMAARRATTRPFMKRWPAISAAAPAIGRSWRPAEPCAPIRRAAASRDARAKRRPNTAAARSFILRRTARRNGRGQGAASRRLRARRRDRSWHLASPRSASHSRWYLDRLVSATQAISDRDGKLTIGGGVTYTQALPYLDRHFPSFAALVRRIGSRQIRNIGTLCRQLANASPIGDTIPCLIALDATIMLRSKRGVRR